jgi:hypothetical protein
MSAQAPCPTVGTPVHVAFELVEYDCRAGDTSVLACTISGSYLLVNPTDMPQTLTLGGTASGDTLTVPGRAPASSMTLTLAARERITLTLRGTRRRELDGQSSWYWSRFFEGGALGLMHPVLHERTDAVARVELSYERARRCTGERGWASADTAVLRTRSPRRWTPTVGYDQHGLCGEEGGVRCTQVEETPLTHISMSYERQRSDVLRAGGVTLGLGATVGQGFRARAAYDVGLGRRFVGAASIEVDTSGNVVLTPALGYAIPLWRVTSWNRTWLPGALIPWVGTPLGVVPDLRGGVRGQLTLQWIFAGLDSTLDYYPRDGRVDVTLMVRLGI